MTIRAAKKYNRSGSPREVLLAFAKLGVSCFGGPIAHIGYFRENSSYGGDGSTSQPSPILSHCVNSFLVPPAARLDFPLA
jgi:hypothetical protein